ncbi:5949_t:CDS:2 [Acaulospora colombiana]|uniref:5949_t:CDS:1 n=1 Tax=Acaulospora colombiana TaxID=27376 RepID=A0ACA9MXM7_9GLOM|nr:5949_t:CDS:2 [Acaulospora colombiana]
MTTQQESSATSTAISSPYSAFPPSASSRGALLPLQNHNHASQSSKAASTKPSRSIFYTPYPRQQRVSSTQFDSASPVDTSTSQTSPIPTSQSDAQNRTVYLSHFDYIEMRCRLTQTELAKKPTTAEPGVIFHSPRDSSVTYDLFFQTTHDFLDISTALQMFPMFIDLPLGLRPSKCHYDATKNNPEDLMLRVRCLFCRGRFGGKNAKAIWERHVKEHWPKAGAQFDTFKNGRLPLAIVVLDREMEIPGPLPLFAVSIASSDYFAHSHEQLMGQDDDTIVFDSVVNPSDLPMTPVESPAKPKDRNHLIFSPVSEDDRGHFRIGSWDVEAHLAELNRLARPCLSKEEALEVITAAAERGSPRKDNDFLFNGSMEEDEDLTLHQSASISDKKRSRRDSIDGLWDQDPYISEPESKRRRVDSFRSDSSSGSSGYDSGFDCSFDETDSPSSFDSPTSPFLALDN